MQSDKELAQNSDLVQDELQPVNPEEHHDDLNDDDHVFPDISSYSKQELLEELRNLHLSIGLQKVSSFMRDLKQHFDDITESERQEAKDQFLHNGGLEEDFQLKKDDVTLAFEKLYGKLRAEITDKLASLEEEKEKNLRIKNAILEKLRELTSGEESSSSLAQFKELQNEWRNTGAVPLAYAKEIWANYNALVEMFYNNRSIYFELKELDRKKNLESKIDIIEKAEQLSKEDNIGEAIKELKKLHEEYKLIGPVPKEEQEVLWNRFKLASDQVYQKRNEFNALHRKVQEENLVKKRSLIEALKAYENYDSSDIKDWKEKTNELLEIQNSWKNTGQVPKEVTKSVSKEFWSMYKGFFRKKDAFFKSLELQKTENLKKKQELCEAAEALMNSDDLSATTELLKKLQAEWSKIGAVPMKEKDAIFKRFNSACDHFFNRKRALFAEQEKEYEDNLKRKYEVIDRITQLATGNSSNSDDIRDLQEEFNAIGYVPKNAIKEVKERYKEAVEQFLKRLDGTEGGSDKGNLKLELEVAAMKSSPDARKKLNKKESDILKKIQSLKADIQSWNTNIDFFANSANAEKLKAQVLRNIENARKELQELEGQLNIIRNTQ